MKEKQSISKFLSRAPKRVNDMVWFYEEPRGIEIVHEIRNDGGKGKYIRTDTFLIGWRTLEAALESYKKAREKSKKK